MVAGRGPGEEVVRQPEVTEVVDDHAVVLVGSLAGAQSFTLGLDQDRSAVLVGTRHHQDLVSAHSHVAREDV